LPQLFRYKVNISLNTIVLRGLFVVFVKNWEDAAIRKLKGNIVLITAKLPMKLLKTHGKMNQLGCGGAESIEACVIN